MCAHGLLTRTALVATPAATSDEVEEQIRFEAEAERNVRRYEQGFCDDGIVGPLNADGSKIAVRHGSRIEVVSVDQLIDCSGAWSRQWQAARSAAIAGCQKQRELTAVTDPVSEEELAYASSEHDTDDDRACFVQEEEDTSSESQNDIPDDLIDQIKEMALWVSQPGRTLVVSSA